MDKRRVGNTYHSYRKFTKLGEVSKGVSCVYDLWAQYEEGVRDVNRRRRETLDVCTVNGPICAATPLKLREKLGANTRRVSVTPLATSLRGRVPTIDSARTSL